MHSHNFSIKGSRVNSTFDIQSSDDNTQLDKYVQSSRNHSLVKHPSTDGLKASARLYAKAMEHHDYIQNKMQEKGIKNIRFVNKSSERMLEKRKPLYYIRSNSTQQIKVSPKNLIKPPLAPFSGIFIRFYI